MLAFMRKSIKKISQVLLMSLCLLFFTAAAFAQNVVTGKVTDTKDGSPAVGVNVTIKGTKTTVQTATDGTFKINAPANATLVFTSVSFGRQEVAVGSKTSLDVSLLESNQQLNEVVVVGYGTQRKKEVTGAISRVGTKEINATAAPSFEAALQGRVAGVQVSQASGLAGAGSYVRIRGIASVSAGGDPLYVIDGIPVTADPLAFEGAWKSGNSDPSSYKLRSGFTQSPLASINPDDIESIEILKDAGAAGIYGSRGANGVILITTKRGKKGKPKFNFSTKVGFSTWAVRPKFLNGAEWLQMRQEAWENDGNTGKAPLPGGLNW